MKIRTSRRWSGDSPPLGPTPARAIEDAKGEQQRVLKRLRGLIESHQESAVRMKVALEVEDVLIVIDALVAEAEQSDPLHLLKCPDEVREYARFSLYDEMLGEPSNVFLATPVSADTTRYEAMPRAFWLDCLRALRREWEA
ncbi:MAG: hypothetical protein MPN21_15940 [Thermoanaerobaculia bacterium]|nr:hypothetical protein [Thermoanaerobaculia bacterium]